MEAFEPAKGLTRHGRMLEGRKPNGNRYNKDEISSMLDALPDDATLEDVQYSIYVRERVERGRREAQQEKVIDAPEIESRMKRWLSE